MTRSYVNSLPTLHPTRRSPAPRMNTDAEALKKRKAKEREREREQKEEEILEEKLKTRIPGWAVMDSYDKSYWKAKERGE